MAEFLNTAASLSEPTKDEEREQPTFGALVDRYRVAVLRDKNGSSSRADNHALDLAWHALIEYEARLRDSLSRANADTERLDFLEAGGFTAFRQSYGPRTACVTDCRDEAPRDDYGDLPRWYTRTLRDGIDASRPTVPGAER